MKRIGILCIAVAVMLGAATGARSQILTIVGTNDTHSQIDPDDADGMGGVLRRKVLIDSIRDADPNVLLVDMGDPVQGTMYFNLYGGEVENMVMNELGYDIRILGNHDFDNGMGSLADNLAGVRSEMLSTNYRFDDPALAAKFKPYVIKDIDGRKIAFVGINLDPKGMIAEGNYDGVEYLDAMKAANATAWHLKHNEGVDKVVALTHIGYYPTSTGTSDVELAEASEDIDLVMGGHSHTLVNPADTAAGAPAWRLRNANGTDIVVTQTGKAGKYIAVVRLDLDTDSVGYEVIPVDSRLDGSVDAALDAMIEPYRSNVAAIMERPVGKVSMALDKDSHELLNLVADFIRDRASDLYPGVDFAIVNKGGIRRGLPKGTITQGQIQSMLPFNNKVVVLEIAGKDILENLAVMARTDGNGLSGEARVEYDPETGAILKATVNGKPIEPDRTYRLATIDYLANGGDYMTPLTRGKVVARSAGKVYDDLLEMLRHGRYSRKTLVPKTETRFIPLKQ